MDKGTRGELLDRLAEAIESVSIAQPLRVAVDGPPAAGKTTLADELALLLRTRGREVIRASIESFLLPRAQRYRRGKDSPEATFEQALDRARIRDQALYGSTADVERRYRSRYIPSQQHYFATARPTDHADIIVHNDELQRPTWEVRPY
jgi:uridine kinase